MAKRVAPVRANRASVTPTSRGATVSTQARHEARSGRPPLPFKVGLPKANTDDEDNLYSDPSVVVGKSAGRRAEAVAAAGRRQRGPSDDELDALGEAELPAASAEPLEVEDDERANADDINAMMRSLGKSFAAATETAPAPAQATTVEDVRSAMRDVIEAEVQRRVTEILGPPKGAVSNGMVQVQQPQQYLATRTVDDAAIDRLWDWLRADTDASAAFFGFMPPTSKQLRAVIDALVQGEQNGVGFIRALVIEDVAVDGSVGVTHFGFAMAAPIFTEDKLALLHVFLEPKLRGRLPQLLPDLMALAAKELPGFKLAVLPSNDAQRRLYGQLLPALGFNSFTLFVK